MDQLYFNQQTVCGPSALQERALREAFLTLYAFAGAEKENHFIFTSSGAEAINHAVFAAYIDITRKTGKNHFLCGALDEAPTILAMSRLQELGCVFQTIPASPEGWMSKKSVAEMITARTAMLSLSAANGLIGVIQPLFEISELCKERDILFHVDATHMLGKSDFNFEECGADMVTFSGPYGGMGGMFLRSKKEISPLILGGNEQGKLRGGPFSISALLEFAKWAKLEQDNRDHYSIEIARLRSLFESTLCTKISNAKVLFQNQARLSHITSIVFPKISSELLLYALHQKGVYGSCGGNYFQHIAHILKACKIPTPDCHSALSFAFSHTVTQEEIEKGAEMIVETVKQLQGYSEHLFHEAT